MPAPSHHGSQLSAPPPQTMLARRSPPPKFRPCMIIVVVLSLGLLFIGLTLTIIAHWPGYTGIGYNPLKIVGPCMLSLGGLVFIGCIVEVVRKNQSEKESFNRQMQERERMIQYANRTAQLSSSARSLQNLGPQPYKASSVPSQQTYPARGMQQSGPSSYAGSQYSGMGMQPYGQAYNNTAYQPTQGYDPDRSSQGSVQNGQSGGRYEIHAYPDPSQMQGVMAAGQTQPTAPAAAEIPQPVRTRTKDHKKPSKAHNNQHANPGYQTDDVILSAQTIEADVHNGGYLPHGYQPDYPPQQYDASQAYDYSQGYSGSQAAYDPSQAYDANQQQTYASGDDLNSSTNDREAKKKRRREKRARREAEAMQMSGGGGGGQQQPLHVNISARPGVSVTITPTGTPSMGRHGGGGGETGI